MSFFSFLLIPARISTSIQSNATVDYSKPVQTVPINFSRSIRGSVVNDWRESTATIQLEPDYDPNSFTITFYAVDNYGQNFETWVSVYPDLQTNNPRFNSGWSTSSIENEPIIMATGLTDITIVFRFRYPSGTGTNPPTTSDFGYCRYSLKYNVLQNYEPSQTTALPSDWTVTTTQTTETTPVVTTTQYFDMHEFSSTGNSIRYYMSTIFGIADSGADITRLMNYIDDKTKYSSAIAAFCLLCGVIVYAMKWE